MGTQVSAQQALHGDVVSRKIAEGKPISITEFQDFLTNELRRFVVWNVKENFRNDLPLSLGDNMQRFFLEWRERFDEFVHNPPLGS